MNEAATKLEFLYIQLDTSYAALALSPEKGSKFLESLIDDTRRQINNGQRTREIFRRTYEN